MSPVDPTEVKRSIARLGREVPQTMSAFARLHAAATADGALSASTKELIALAISVAKGCSGCIAYHGEQALARGATHEEYLDAVAVAVMMSGGPGTVYGAEATAVLDGVSAAGP